MVAPIGPVAPAALEALGRFDTPTIANAIETLDIRPRNVGFTDSEIRAIFPDMSPIVGYAVTGQIRSATATTRQYSRKAWWQFILSIPAPRIVVFEDLDDPPGVGAFWGEVQANIHRTLGCVGTVTNGSVRDLTEVRAVPFAMFARHVAVSHAYVRLEEFGGEVTVSGLSVRTGDLLQADQHGVLSVPAERVDDLMAAAGKLAERERRIIDYCHSDQFTIDGLESLVG